MRPDTPGSLLRLPVLFAADTFVVGGAEVGVGLSLGKVFDEVLPVEVFSVYCKI